MGATAGDLMAAEVVQTWLADEGIAFDIAIAKPLTHGIPMSDSRPSAYSHLVFACGPFGDGPPITEMLTEFAVIPLVATFVSLLQSLSEWNPFHRTFARDVDNEAFPDLSLRARTGIVPVIGLILHDHQKKYRDRFRHDDVHNVIHEFIASKEVAVVEIDTRLDQNRTGLRTESEIISLIAKTDVVITTRLHGLVLAMRQGVPAVVIDAIEGGAKVSAQVMTLGWPYVIASDSCHRELLDDYFARCIEAEALQLAADCPERAIARIGALKSGFLDSLRQNVSERVLRLRAPVLDTLQERMVRSKQ